MNTSGQTSPRIMWGCLMNCLTALAVFFVAV